MLYKRKYLINEIFYSIQGEGRWTGLPAIFIRFANCNLSCQFCDTDFEVKQFLYFDEIIDHISDYPCRTIILTGGEPALQIDRAFVGRLKRMGYKVHIETNGTIKLPSNLDWITISPKEKWIVKKGDELKVVFIGQDLDHYKDSRFKHYYLQPCSRENEFEVINRVLEDNFWKLSIQVQKTIGIK